MLELLTETITGNVTEHYVSVPMQFGIENEGLARTTYEMERGVEVEKIGYVRHATIPRCGASPDGLIGEHGLVEIKVPDTTTHLEYILNGESSRRLQAANDVADGLLRARMVRLRCLRSPAALTSGSLLCVSTATTS